MAPTVGFMTATEITGNQKLRQREPLVTRPLLLRFVSIAGASASFYLPLSVVPLYTRPAGPAAAGFATGTLLLVTVAVELLTPRLAARTGCRLALGPGLLLLGLPALALLGPPDLPVILAVSIARGAGFAVVVVVGGAMNVSLIPPGRRGEGLALAGLVSGVPALVCLPLGVFAAARWGFAPVFIATAAAALLAVVTVPALPGGERPGRGAGAAGGEAAGTAAGGTARPASAPGVVSLLAAPSVSGPAALFSAATVAAGVLFTFIPLAITQQPGAVPAIALFAEPAAATLARLAAGRSGTGTVSAGCCSPVSGWPLPAWQRSPLPGSPRWSSAEPPSSGPVSACCRTPRWRLCAPGPRPAATALSARCGTLPTTRAWELARS